MNSELAMSISDGLRELGIRCAVAFLEVAERVHVDGLLARRDAGFVGDGDVAEAARGGEKQRRVDELVHEQSMRHALASAQQRSDRQAIQNT